MRRAYGRKTSKNLQSASPTDKIKNVKVSELTGKQVRQLASPAFITNDDDQGGQYSDSPTSDYVNQAVETVTQVTSLQMLPSGGPWPSSIGIYNIVVPRGEVKTFYVQNLYFQTTGNPTQSEIDEFNGIIRIHGISMVNTETSTATMNVYLSGSGGDGYGTGTKTFMIEKELDIAAGNLHRVQMQQLSNELYISNSAPLVAYNQATSGDADVSVQIYYSVYSYGGQ